MSYFQQAQNEGRTTLKMLYNLMTNENGYLNHHPIKSYLNDQTVKLDETSDKLTFTVGPHNFVIEPEYILFQGQYRQTHVYVHTYEIISNPIRLLKLDEPRIFRLDEIMIALDNLSRYTLPLLQSKDQKQWYIEYFDHIVAYIADRAGAPVYEILQEKEAERLHDAVYDRIQKGWKPVGGVSAVFAKLNEKSGSPDNEGQAVLFYIQAMVK